MRQKHVPLTRKSASKRQKHVPFGNKCVKNTTLRQKIIPDRAYPARRHKSITPRPPQGQTKREPCRRHIREHLSRMINVQAPVSPHCASSVREKRYRGHKDEQLYDAMLFLSDHRGCRYLLPCSLLILTELVRISPAAPPNELRCTPTASKVTLSPDHSSSGQ